MHPDRNIAFETFSPIALIDFTDLNAHPIDLTVRRFWGKTGSPDAFLCFEPLQSKVPNATLYLKTMSTFSENFYNFISGKNWKLSLAELTSYLDARSRSFEVSEFSRTFFTIKTQRPLEVAVIDDLGGTLKVVQVSTFVPTEHVIDAFMKNDKQAKKELKYSFPLEMFADRMPRAESGKAVFGVSVYWADPAFRHAAHLAQRYIGSALKDELKEQDKKARFMGFPRDRDNPQLTSVEVLKQRLIENHAEVVLSIGKRQTAIGTTVSVHNPFEFQKRDLDKPVQRKIFGIPPRIAKIMINLTHCTPGKVFLDPFCGVGSILQEALLAKAKVIGLDINSWCVEAAKRNLDWLTREYAIQDADYALVQGDAKNIRYKIRDEIDCIATEPDLGPALRKIPTAPYAEKILSDLKPLFNDFLIEAHIVLREGAYLALVTPYVKTRSGDPATMGIEEIANNIGFKTVKPFSEVSFVTDASDFPLKDLSCFLDVDDRHKIGREINIFRKTEH
jgi:tRNA G10  N-methylase Trm11